ncbi:hypothetical protein EHZ25_27275 [Paraburkholderia tropica]|nr:hypothetical protein EHZ25_27275 [Paraburkholderia tropica]
MLAANGIRQKSGKRLPPFSILPIRHGIRKPVEIRQIPLPKQRGSHHRGSHEILVFIDVSCPARGLAECVAARITLQFGLLLMRDESAIHIYAILHQSRATFGGSI